MTMPPHESYSEALADLRDAATAFLRADRDGLSRLVAARDRATTLLGDRSAGTVACNCGAASGFHSPICVLVMGAE